LSTGGISSFGHDFFVLIVDQLAVRV